MLTTVPDGPVLVVPGSSEKMLQKASGLDADEVVLDLEDAVAPDEKVGARARVIEALRELPWGPARRTVRVNACGTPWVLHDLLELAELAGDVLDGIVLPKARHVADVHFVDQVLAHIEAERGVRVGRTALTLQLEDAAGVLAIGHLLGATDRIDAVMFGPGDLAASLRQPTLSVGAPQPDYPGDHWHSVSMQVLVHARAAGVNAIDGPYGRVHDVDGFIELARRSRALGFDGKWVLHPGQIAAANQVFGVTQVEVERAVDLLDAYDTAVIDRQRCSHLRW